MKTNNLKWLAWAGFAFAAVTIVAWKGTNKFENTDPSFGPQQSDTTPSRKRSDEYKRDYKVGDLDKAMRELDEAMVSMDKNFKIDFSKMNKEMKAAMEELKNVDFDKIGREVEASLKKIDWDKTKTEVEKAMREAEITMKNVDMSQVKKEMERAKESINEAKISSKIDLSGIQESVEKSLAGARVSMEHAKKEIASLKEFTEALEKDGLINRKKGFKIEIKNGEMFLNGTKQSKEVNDKYRKYFREEDYTIRSDGDSISSL